MTPKIVSFSGFARSGKGSFASIFTEKLVDYFPNITTGRFDFATALREELDPFLQENFGISAFTTDPVEKEIIRPLLIAYGMAKREVSNGRYWIDKLSEKIFKSNCDVAILSDLRFAENDKDELGWLKENDGLNFHIRRFNWTEKGGKSFLKAPNKWEKENEPKLIKGANKVLELQYFEEYDEAKIAMEAICEDLILKNFTYFNKPHDPRR